jgi:lipoprotein signal peptidase
MVKRNNIYKYIYFLCVVLLIFLHFFCFEKTGYCSTLNTGFAFGLMNTLDSKYIVLISIIVLLVLSAGIIFFRQSYKMFLLLGIFVLSLGIFLDRIYGGVCDYISILNFPVFNLLDIGITVSICLILAGIMKDIWKKQ